MRNEWIKRLSADVRVVVLTDGRPISDYVVRLEVLSSGAWKVVHLFDNAHGRHDEHAYRGDAKQPAAVFFEGAVSAALPAAIALLDARWGAIIERWRTQTP